MTHLGQALRAERLAAGRTQVQVGEHIGKPQSVVSRIERQSDMHVTTMLAYLAAIDVRPSEFMEGTFS